MEIDRGRITAKVTATGTLSALVTVQVGSQVSGTIAGLYADFNSAVTKGKRIAKIDPACSRRRRSRRGPTWSPPRAQLVKALGRE